MFNNGTRLFFIVSFNNLGISILLSISLLVLFFSESLGNESSLNNNLLLSLFNLIISLLFIIFLLLGIISIIELFESFIDERLSKERSSFAEFS